MYTRNQYIITWVLIVLFGITCFGSAWLYFGGRYRYMAVLLPLAVLEAGLLVWFFNRTNHRIAFFFRALRNQDGTIRFPEKVRGRTLSQLNRSLNDVNRVYSELARAGESSEQYYRSLLGHVGTGLIVFDDSGMVETVNPAFERIFGVYGIQRIDDMAKAGQDVPGKLRGLKPGKPEILGLSVDGTLKQLLLGKAVLFIGEREMNLVSVENIKDEMDRKELESWIRLIRVLNHEIVNTVTPITTLSATFYELLQKDGKTDRDNISNEVLSDTTRALQSIHEHGKGLIKFVESYRQLTRLPDPAFKKIPLKEFISRELYALKGHPGGKQAGTVLEVDPEDLAVTGDIELLQRVFSNVLINALQSMERSEKKEIKVSALLDHYNRIVVRITDTGCGIPEDIREQVFVPFFSTREGGSGIGLSLCRRIMQLHHGGIAIDPAPGGGTTVSLQF